MTDFHFRRKEVMAELDELLAELDESEVTQYIDMILTAEQVFFVGVGRVKLSLAAAIKRFTHLGINCHEVGALNESPITHKDLLVIGSSSGESVFPLAIAERAKNFGAKIVHLTSNRESSIARLADSVVVFSSPNKVNQSVVSVQPMTTVFEQGILLLNDILTLILMERKGLSFMDLTKKHANLE